MCQLTFANTHGYNHVYGYYQMLFNGADTPPNKDGWGIWADNTLTKNANAIEKSENFLKTLQYLSSPAMMHVRNASFSRGVKLLGDVYNHPFEYTDFVLAHNGTLEPKVYPKIPPKDKIDTQVFCDSLQDYITENQCDIPTALSKVMEDYKGKFAFLVYDKRTGEYFAARGKIAKLHISYISYPDSKVPGYIINTGKDTLLSALRPFSHIIQLVYDVTMGATVPIELDEETIYRLDETEIVKVGTIKETPITTVVVYDTVWDDNNHYNREGYSYGGGGGRFVNAHEKIVDTLLSPFVDEGNLLDHMDIFIMAQIVYNKPLYCLNTTELNNLKKIITSLLASDTETNLAAKRQIWVNILDVTDLCALDIYETYDEDIVYPFILNTKERLRAFYKKNKKKNKQYRKRKGFHAVDGEINYENMIITSSGVTKLLPDGEDTDVNDGDDDEEDDDIWDVDTIRSLE